MRTALALVVLIATGSASAQTPPWQIPDHDVDRACSRLGDAASSCVRQEQFAYDVLKAQWDGLSDRAKRKSLQQAAAYKSTPLYYQSLGAFAAAQARIDQDFEDRNSPARFQK